MKNYIVRRNDDNSLHNIKSKNYPKSSEYTVIGLVNSEDAGHLFDVVNIVDPDTNESIPTPQLRTADRDAEVAAEAATKAANEYKRQRAAAYPPIGDQLDALYKKLELGDDTDYDAIAADIAAVKALYPKPS